MNVKRVTGFFTLVCCVFILHGRVLAAPCTQLPAVDDTTLSNCELTIPANTVNGVDQASNSEISTANGGEITLDAGASITINAGGTLAAGSFKLNGGTIAIATGGFTKPNTPIYVPDLDGDGWATSSSYLYTATQSGRRRLSLMKSLSTLDCNGGDYSEVNYCCTANGDSCSSDGGCCSSICGTNADGDNFFSISAGHTGSCQVSSLPYTDCYDSNANTYPGSTYCSGTNRGDGSYDYNCSSSETTCNTTYTNACSSILLTNEYCSGTTCASGTVTGYASQSAGCGQTGCTCSSTPNRGTVCSAVGGMYPTCDITSTTPYCATTVSGTQNCQ